MAISFMEAGRQYLLDAQEVKRTIEAEYQIILGEDRWRELNAALTQLLRLGKTM